MATTSYIGVEIEPEVYKFIYCHYDGYLDHNGLILNEAYKDREMVEELVNGGDISSLGVNPYYVKYKEELSIEESINNDKEVIPAIIRYKPIEGEDNYFILEGKQKLEEFLNDYGGVYLYTLNDEWEYSGYETNYKLSILEDTINSNYTVGMSCFKPELEEMINERNKLTDLRVLEEDYEEDDYDM